MGTCWKNVGHARYNGQNQVCFKFCVSLGEMFGKFVGHVWKMSRSCFEAVWDMFGRLLRYCWKLFGRRLAGLGGSCFFCDFWDMVGILDLLETCF